jgi:hypothetical protein
MNFSGNVSGGFSRKSGSDWQNHSFEIVFIPRDSRVVQSATQLSIFLHHSKSSREQMWPWAVVARVYTETLESNYIAG